MKKKIKKSQPQIAYIRGKKCLAVITIYKVKLNMKKLLKN